MAEDQIKTNVVVGIGVEGGDAAANSIAKLRAELGKLRGEQSALDKLTRSFAGAKSAADAGKSAADGMATVREQAAALKPAIQGIRDAVKATGLPQSYLKTVGLDSKSITEGGKSLKNFERLLGGVDKAYENTLDRRGAKVAAVADKERQIKTSLLDDLRDRQARAAIQERVQAAEAARAKIASAKQAATEVGKVEAKAASDSRDLTARRVRPAGQLPPGTKERYAREAAAEQAAYEKAKRSAATSSRPFGPSAAELRAARAPIAAAKTAVASGSGDGRQVGAAPAIRGLEQLAAAARSAAASLKALSTSANSAGRRGSAGGGELVATRMMREMRTGFAKEYASLHRAERRNEATVFPRSQYAAGAGGSGGAGGPRAPMQVAPAYGQIDKAAAGAARSISAVKQEGDAITGQVKNVLGMAFGYQAIHAVASQLQQVFGHLQGGVIQFNSMLEQATVGFTTLFKNQAQQAQATNELLGENAVGIDYMAMGYKDAEDAAEGVIETIRQFANVTPFRFAEIQESTLRMRAFGFDMSEILRENSESVDQFSGGIVAVGNAVAALGGGADAFRRITYALGQMKQAGRVYQNDMMQLANAGIGGYKYIAEALMKEITTDGKGQKDKVIKGQEALYSQLESNAIETVRRLTTSGKVSGEAASRAILLGLERDFGGGMVAQSKTFAGAFSTVADMSQSLVAESFRPLYNAIRDITYEFSIFLQDPKVRDSALAFGDVIEKIIKQLRPMGALLMSIGQKIGRDFSNAMATIGSSVGGIGGTFGAFAIGIREIIKLLENDFARTVIATAALIGIAFKFASANPFMVSIGLLITLLGGLKMAVNENLFGIGNAFREMAASVEPMIAAFRDDFLPVLINVLMTISQGVIAGLSAAFTALAPTISGLAQVLGVVLTVLGEMEPVLRIIGFLIGVSLASKLVVGGIGLLTAALFRATVQMRAFSVASIAASANVSRVKMVGGGLMAASMVGTMAVQGAAGAGAISPETAQSLQIVADIAMAIGAIALVAKPVIGALQGLVGFIGALARSIGPLIGIIVRVVAAIAAFVGISTGMAFAIAGIALLIGGLIAFLIGEQEKVKDEQGTDLKPGDPGYADRKRSRYYDTTGTVLEGSGYYKDPMYASNTIQSTSGEANYGNSLTNPNQRSLVAFRKSEREFQFPRVIKQAKSEMKDLTNYQKLLINQQNAANDSLKKYNGLLAIAKQRVQDALDVLQKVAEEVLNDIMNPDFENPYALDAGEMVKYEELLEIEQEMSFVTFENRQGITRSFDEYKDILNSILPLTEDEVNAGEVSLKMVTERLKIEKERRKEQERIKALAEAEYDLGLATLQQYDESLDPLTRAVNLRAAQKKYETDIADLRFEGLENLVDEATSSRDWGRLTEATKDRLEQFKEGQELILEEMTKMFEDYNRDIAWILENPDLSWAEKKSKIEEKLEELQVKLEDRFGITLEMMGDKVTDMNSAMRSVMDAANMKGIDMNVTFAQDLIKNLETKGFKVLIDYIMKKYNEVLRLMRLVAQATATIESLANPENMLKGKKAEYGRTLNRLLGGLISGGVASDELVDIKRGIQGLSGKNDMSSLQTAYNLLLDEIAAISSFYQIPVYASGGIMDKNQLSLVGEKGPELVLPQSRGLVLNNSISSRLLGMLSGTGNGGGGGVNNVIINNPVVRSDSDIRKLAQEISRVQASQFRTEGGRLY